jgi:DNA-binding CsgD family transcriptional regulator
MRAWRECLLPQLGVVAVVRGQRIGVGLDGGRATRSKVTHGPHKSRHLRGHSGRRATRTGFVLPVGMPSEILTFLENRFDLSPRQAHLVSRLAAGESLRCCTEVLGIKYETGRSYLKSAFRKTKTHRQAELVLIVIEAVDEMRR